MENNNIIDIHSGNNIIKNYISRKPKNKNIMDIDNIIKIDIDDTEYINNTKNGKGTKSKKKNEYTMPTRENYSILLKVNYTIKQLKEIAVHYRIKLGSVNKSHIIEKIYNYFKHYDNAVIIQRSWRKFLLKKYNKLRGPARFNRSLCINDTDFFTMDSIKDIPFSQFYSFKDSDNIIYGFDIMSIYNLFNHSSSSGIQQITNPYNRNIFLKSVKKNMMKIINLSKLFNDEIILNINNTTINSGTNDTINEDFLQNIPERIFSVFHDIDILGNYTDQQWFNNLSRDGLIRFIYELNDIWSYRANLSSVVKSEICPDYYDLFRMMHIVDIRIVSIPILQDIAITIIEKLVRSGINHDSKCLGANYVLCALTLVSPDAAVALPWLYQSVF